MGESGIEEEHDEEAAPPRSAVANIVAIGVVLAAVLVFVFVFDFLALGDGALGAQSETLPFGQNPRPDGALEDLVAREPGGVMTLALPLRNRGLIPVTVTDLKPAATDGPCPWVLSSLGQNRERAAAVAQQAPAAVQFKVSGGGTAQLYMGATFPPDTCASDDEAEVSITDLSVEYKVLGIIPRRQDVPMGTVITTTGDLEDPRLEAPPETLD